MLDPAWAGRIGLWESAGELVGVAHLAEREEAYFQVHPAHRTALEPAMIDWAESLRSEAALGTFVFDYDALRQRLLRARGYAPTAWGGVTRHLRLGAAPLPPVELAAGYTLRPTRLDDPTDEAAVAVLLNRAFNRDFHSGPEIHNFTRYAPSFHPQMQLVAVAADGALAALAAVCYEPTHRHGIFEPVCTHPDHRRRGLARSLMLEGLNRLKALGGETASVETGDDEAANALYEAMGFTEAYHGLYWQKPPSAP